MSQGKLESSISSINDLLRQGEGLAERRTSEMAVIMKERDRQPDKRLKLMSELRHRRDTDVDNRIVDIDYGSGLKHSGKDYSSTNSSGT